jgi:NAD(P)-dependent dehydrogenase (short-subunit alcohol dehydrogenase family)
MVDSPSRAVLVTGCSSGIGAATAARLVASGRPVYATARRVETLASLEAAGCHVLPLDVTDEASMAAAVEEVERAHGAVGALVNNAGYSQSGPIEEVPIDAARKQFETNVFGAMRLCQMVLPAMRAQRSGRIVNVSSMGAHFSLPGGGWYHATKHALNAVSDALRFEVGGFGVRVVTIEPGLIRSQFADTAAASMSAATSGEGGPYERFNRTLAKATKAVYEGPVSKLGGGPDAVAKVIVKAIDAETPRARYRVTPSAHLMIAQRRVTPDRAWDALMRSQLPQPK